MQKTFRISWTFYHNRRNIVWDMGLCRKKSSSLFELVKLKYFSSDGCKDLIFFTLSWFSHPSFTRLQWILLSQMRSNLTFPIAIIMTQAVINSCLLLLAKFVSIQNSNVEILIPNLIALGGGGLCEVIRSWGWCTHEWD